MNEPHSTHHPTHEFQLIINKVWYATYYLSLHTSLYWLSLEQLNLCNILIKKYHSRIYIMFRLHFSLRRRLSCVSRTQQEMETSGLASSVCVWNRYIVRVICHLNGYIKKLGSIIIHVVHWWLMLMFVVWWPFFTQIVYYLNILFIKWLSRMFGTGN